MSTRRMLKWLMLGATAGLLVLLKWLHIGVTHYNIFLLILLGWSLGIILAFRALSGPDRSGQPRSY
jgi:hypothetical protein